MLDCPPVMERPEFAPFKEPRNVLGDAPYTPPTDF